MTITVETKTTFILDSTVFGDEVNKLLDLPGRPGNLTWECGYVDEMSNGSYMELNIPNDLSDEAFYYNENKEWVSMDTVEFVDKWIAHVKSDAYDEYKDRDNQPGIYTMLEYLRRKGLLPEGDYLIKVWW